MGEHLFNLLPLVDHRMGCVTQAGANMVSALLAGEGGGNWPRNRCMIIAKPIRVLF